MRSTKSILSVFAIALALSACSRTNDRGTAAPLAAPVAGAPVSVTLESPGMGALPSALFGGSLYYAGQDGQQYVVRVANNTARRVEVVVTVDGRDVVSGELGDYRKQRGYIIEPFGQIAIDGFRQSLEQVAAFRFSGLQDSYTALQGTPQHAGVIGIAVFEERGNPKASGPLAVGPSTQSPFPNGGDRDIASARIAAAPHDGRMAAEDDASAPAAEAGATADFNARKSEVAPSSAQGGGNFAPPPVPRNELGTEYGESQSSSVHEVAFKRKHKRRPDAVFSVFYDSPNGLAARGIPLGGGVAFVPAPAPEPFPDRAPRR